MKLTSGERRAQLESIFVSRRKLVFGAVAILTFGTPLLSSCRSGGVTYTEKNCFAARGNIDVLFTEPRTIGMLVQGGDSLRVDSVTSVRGRDTHTCGDTLHLLVTRVVVDGKQRSVPRNAELRLIPDSTATTSRVPRFLRMSLVAVLFAAVIGIAAS